MTTSDQVWRDLARLLTARRVQLDPRFRNLSEFSRASGVNYKTLQRAEAGRSHQFGRNTLLELDVAYALRPGSIEAVLSGRDAAAADGSIPLTPAEPQGPEDEDWDGMLVGEPHLRAGETLRWKRLEPRGGYGRIRYVMTYTDPDSGAQDNPDAVFSDERDIWFVVQYFREQRDAYPSRA